MIVHNTTYHVLPEVEERWLTWMKQQHIPQIKSLQGIRSCRLLKLLTEVEGDGITYTIQTEIDNVPAGEAFLQELSPSLQNHIRSQFPGQVLYFETLLRVLTE